MFRLSFYNGEIRHSPVSQFSGMAAASTHDKWFGFGQMCVSAAMTYSAYAPWKTENEDHHKLKRPRKSAMCKETHAGHETQHLIVGFPLSDTLSQFCNRSREFDA